jgi:hypothetical protein
MRTSYLASRGRPLPLSQTEALQLPDILPVVSIVFLRCFQDERFSHKFGCVRPERSLGIVVVNHLHVVQTQPSASAMVLFMPASLEISQPAICRWLQSSFSALISMTCLSGSRI